MTETVSNWLLAAYELPALPSLPHWLCCTLMCRSTSWRVRNDSGHSGHWCPASCASRCRCSEPFVVKAAEHLVHWKFLLPACVFMCAFNTLPDVNDRLHSVHWNGLWPTICTCTKSFQLIFQVYLHCPAVPFGFSGFFLQTGCPSWHPINSMHLHTICRASSDCQ